MAAGAATLATSTLRAESHVDIGLSLGIPLPHGYIDVTVGRDHYYSYRGTFYQRGPHGLMGVRAPLSSANCLRIAPASMWAMWFITATGMYFTSRCGTAMWWWRRRRWSTCRRRPRRPPSTSRCGLAARSIFSRTGSFSSGRRKGWPGRKLRSGRWRKRSRPMRPPFGIRTTSTLNAAPCTSARRRKATRSCRRRFRPIDLTSSTRRQVGRRFFSESQGC